jgi:hypothetical protein
VEEKPRTVLGAHDTWVPECLWDHSLAQSLGVLLVTFTLAFALFFNHQINLRDVWLYYAYFADWETEAVGLRILSKFPQICISSS